jgi:quercetin dioxygenase-like cupin family protein
MSTAAASATVPIRNFHGEIRVRGDDTGGALTVVEHVLPAGYIAMPLHTHRRETETTYVLEGTLWVQLDRRVHRVHAGQTLVKPAGVPHTFWNEGAADARFLEMSTPGGLDRWYEEIAAVIPTSGAVDTAPVLEISRRYGLEFEMDSLIDILSRHSVRLA